MTVRQFHRGLALFFSPFLIVTSLSGLLWAFSSYLYLKPAPPKQKIQAIKILIQGVDGATVRAFEFQSAKELTVDDYSIQMGRRPMPALHQWVMKLHKLEFFGTHKELTLFPGVGLLLMLCSGILLFKRGIK